MRQQPGKRTYRSVGEFLADVWFVLGHLPGMVCILRKGTLPLTFRERLMLAVISVYGCRMCSWAHTREAFKSGVDRDEITALLAGSVDDCPPDEAVGVLYAQHWADSDTHPSPEAVKRLVDTYGAEKARAIDLMLRMMRAGNLTGNTWDRLLSRVSFGRLGSQGHAPVPGGPKALD